MRGEYIRRADAMGKITSSETQKALRAMTGEEAYVALVGILNELPTADVAPVVHGWWIEKTAHARRRYFECSACGAQENQHTAIKGRFCWSCGARMDGAT